MILVDYSPIAISNIFSEKVNMGEENLIRHMILNSVRAYRKKFFSKYGEMIFAIDSNNNWRKEYFPQYKENRKKTRDKNPEMWEKLYQHLDMIKNEISENFHYPVIEIDGCEADDVIGALARKAKNPTLILSGDKDFAQLQTNPNIDQFSPVQKKWIKHDDPVNFLLEQVYRGDADDGVPNVLSDDDVFIRDDKKQTIMTQKRFDEIWNSNIDDLPDNVQKNIARNRKMIRLDHLPKELNQKIINRYESYEGTRKNAPKVLNYLVKNDCKLLIDHVEDFL